MSEPFTLSTCDPRLDPHKPVMINGYLFVPATVDARELPLSSFLVAAEAIVNSEPVITIYAACEWDDLHEDGKQWVAGIVRETLARAGRLLDGVEHNGVPA